MTLRRVQRKRWMWRSEIGEWNTREVQDEIRIGEENNLKSPKPKEWREKRSQKEVSTPV